MRYIEIRMVFIMIILDIPEWTVYFITSDPHMSGNIYIYIYIVYVYKQFKIYNLTYK